MWTCPLPPIAARAAPQGSPVERAQNAGGTVRRPWNYFQDQRRPLLILAGLVSAGSAVGMMIPVPDWARCGQYCTGWE